MRKFEALIDELGSCDFGHSGIVFLVTSLEKGKVYTQSKYDSKRHFTDDNDCSRNIEELLKENKIKELH